jgi:hypothetical protein
MTRKRSKRRIVVVICAIVRRVRRIRAAVRPGAQLVMRCATQLRQAVAPRVEAALALVVRVSGCSGTAAEVVSVHVALAALGAGGLTLAAAFAGPGSAQLLKLAGAAGVGALALHAVFMVMRHQGTRRALRPLLLSALAELPARQTRLPAARVLTLLCEPQRFWTELARTGAALIDARLALPRLALAQAKRVTPGLGPALDVLGACQAGLLSGSFVRELALAAGDVQRLELAA